MTIGVPEPLNFQEMSGEVIGEEVKQLAIAAGWRDGNAQRSGSQRSRSGWCRSLLSVSYAGRFPNGPTCVAHPPRRVRYAGSSSRNSPVTRAICLLFFEKSLKRFVYINFKQALKQTLGVWLRAF
jgi:hypothetical protein